MILIDANVAMEYRKIPVFFYKSQIAFTRPVFEEIKELAEAKKEKVLLELIKGVKIIETKEKNADKSMVEAAVSQRLKVATFDRILIDQLKKAGVHVLTSRGEIIRALN